MLHCVSYSQKSVIAFSIPRLVTLTRSAKVKLGTWHRNKTCFSQCLKSHTRNDLVNVIGWSESRTGELWCGTSSGWEETSSRAAKQMKSPFFQPLPGCCTMDSCYTVNTLAGSCTSMKKWMPRHSEQACIENHPDVTCSEGTGCAQPAGTFRSSIHPDLRLI